MLRGFLFLLVSSSFALAQDITFTIDAIHDLHTIPDAVYGVNDVGIAGSTVNRHGGNRLTGFNWENNASNAGTDYFNSSDSYLGDNAGIGDSQKPGALLEAWLNADRAAGLKSILTLPLAGYVAADTNGSVSANETAPGARWKQVVVDKSSAASLDPDTTDGVVYLEEMVNYLVAKFGSTTGGGVAAYCLDNEPALWPSTHPRIHPNATTYQELVSRHTAAATMTTAVDPSAQIYGPVLYGWNAHLNLQNAPDANAFNNTYGTFTNYYLAQMKSASDAAGRRLLHRYDMHWYPEARGDNRIVFGSGPGTSNDIDARLQAPRSLWDPSYVETSWITQYTTNGEGIRLLPRLQESIDQYFPGTGLSLTEYNYGASNHISGGVAQADVLGILGRYKTAGCFWPLNDDNSYVAAAFQLYRNYDGAGSAFGTISLDATASDDAKGGAHAARVSATKLTVVAVNRSQAESQNARFDIALPDGESLAAVKPFRIDSAGGATVHALSGVAPSANGFSDVLPAMSATLYEVQLTTAATSGQLRNISTRARVGTGENVLIGGFIETGSYTRRLLLRAIGPSLAQAGVTDSLADPILETHDPDGPSSSNDNWINVQKSEIEATGLAPKNQLESAMVTSYGPNSYTAILRGKNNGTGIGLFEVYALDQRTDTELANISTRGFVGTRDDVMIGGFIIGGDAARVVVRAIGPSLGAAGISGALQDPTLELHNGDGAVLGSNDNWTDAASPDLAPTGLAPRDDRESALIATLPPGNYTAIVRGKNDTAGIGLVEVYNVH